MAVSRTEYLALLHPAPMSTAQRRTRIRLRLALILWCLFVTTVVFPPAILVGLLVPGHMRRYARKQDLQTRSRWSGVVDFAVDGQRGLTL